MNPCVPLRALFLLLAVVCVSTKSTHSKHRNVFYESVNAVVWSGPRIIGGYDAQDGEFPHQVSVRSDSRTMYFGHFCGGSILNATTVVTAAHCMYNVAGSEIGPLYIVAGSLRLSTGGVKVYVKSKLVHPDYGPVYQDYDIALLFLQTPLPLDGKTIAPVRLQDDEDLPSGIPCATSGWGRTVDSALSTLPDKLQGVKVPIIDYERCANYYQEDTEDYSPVIETQVCAGYEEGKRDACQGDSGGPLVCNGLLTGITSWGLGCAAPRFPGVYSDVAFLRPWIEEHVVLDGEYPTPSPVTLPSTTTSFPTEAPPTETTRTKTAPTETAPTKTPPTQTTPSTSTATAVSAGSLLAVCGLAMATNVLPMLV